MQENKSVFDSEHNVEILGLKDSRYCLWRLVTYETSWYNKIMIHVSKTVDLNDRDFIVRMLYKVSYFLLPCDIFTTACFSFLTAIYCSVAYDNRQLLINEYDDDDCGCRHCRHGKHPGLCKYHACVINRQPTEEPWMFVSECDRQVCWLQY